ncbi:hypothetical protein PG991_012198 [Apiospora marii]|uniref:Uncharacterized protein n=1 Tax=Apiospora marii TaxID=335849 RepID=A0ABR1R957_9PEZI
MTTNDSAKSTDGGSPLGQETEQVDAAPGQDPEYTIDDMITLLFGLPLSFFARYDLTPWIDVPNFIDVPSVDAAGTGCQNNKSVEDYSTADVNPNGQLTRTSTAFN